VSTPKRTLAERIADLGQVREYPRRTVIFHEGDRSDLIYVVLSGQLEVFLADSEGREIVINEIRPGELFGEMSLDGNPRSASVITTQPSRLSVVSPQAIRGLLATDPDAAFELLVTVIRRTRNATRVAGNLALMDAYGRLSRLLLELARPVDGILVIEDRPTQQQLADRIGATREMVSRILTDMRLSRYIAVEKNRIIIFDGLDPPR
jgi:CRP/FNR family transcriptional regulator, cyclic AMP receptor protein